MGNFEKGQDELEHLFTHHPPTDDQIPRYEKIRAAAKDFAAVLYENCPTSADRTHAIRLIRSAVMTANASIALHKEVTPDEAGAPDLKPNNVVEGEVKSEATVPAADSGGSGSA